MDELAEAQRRWLNHILETTQWDTGNKLAAAAKPALAASTINRFLDPTYKGHLSHKTVHQIEAGTKIPFPVKLSSTNHGAVKESSTDVNDSDAVRGAGGTTLSEGEQILLECYRHLSPAERRKLLRQALQMSGQQQEEEQPESFEGGRRG